MNSKDKSNGSNGWTAEPGQNLKDTATNSGLVNALTKYWDQAMDMELKTFQMPDPIPWNFDECLHKNRGEHLNGFDHEVSRKLSDAIMNRALGYTIDGQKVKQARKFVLALIDHIAQDVWHNIYKKALHLTDDQKKNLSENIFISPLTEKEFCLMHKIFSAKIENTPFFYPLFEKQPDLKDARFLGLNWQMSATEGDESDQNHEINSIMLGFNLTFQVLKGIPTVIVDQLEEKISFKNKLDGTNSSGDGAVTDDDRGKNSKQNTTVGEAKKAGLNNVEKRKRNVQEVGAK